MRRLVLYVGFTVLSSGHASAVDVGIPVCDEFLAKYEICVNTKIPAAYQATFKAQWEQLRQSWIATAKDPNTRPAMEAACKQTLEQLKGSLLPYGCSF